MAPQPQKESTKTTPRKIATSTPTKATRTSPRKKAWASPAKLTPKKITDFFSEDDIANLSNKSWAQMTEEDEALNEIIQDERKCKSESRRKGRPRKLNKTEVKPKFVRSLELTNEVFASSSLRKSREARNKANNEKIDLVKIDNQESTSKGTGRRKRCLSNASTVNEDASPRKRRQNESNSGKPDRKAPRRRLCDSSSTSGSVPASPHREGWEEPTLGWCTDEAVLKRRTREIERAKEKDVYKRYSTEIPIRDRIKGVHPRTPNKLINYSRRSWDTQIKKWKKSLYDWAGEEPSDSVNTSFCSYSSDDAMSVKEEEIDLENTPVLRDIDIQVRPESDCMASLLGKFDIDSQMGANEESTLKASNAKVDPSAPIDFSQAL